ncbi:MAG: hypothetical protein J6Y15_03265, partial [Bacteroidaceae bacterium]|nr:hypothetical protein [Bacteroidaceae bacterium]
LVAKQEVITDKVSETNRKLEAITQDVEDIKQKPAKHWEELIKVVLAAVAGGVITYLLTRLGLK